MSCNCTPCSPPAACDPNTEPLSSMLLNLVTRIYGGLSGDNSPLIRTCNSQGQVVWTLKSRTQVGCIAPLTGEGDFEYTLRVLNAGIMFRGGAWDPAATYCQNTFVVYNGIGYSSLAATTNEQPDVYPLVWQVVIPSGPAGPAGYPIANLTAAFVQPAVAATVSISVSTSAWMVIGQPIFIAVGGNYTVVLIVGNTVTIRNSGGSGNAVPTATVPAADAAVGVGYIA